MNIDALKAIFRLSLIGLLFFVSSACTSSRSHPRLSSEENPIALLLGSKDGQELNRQELTMHEISQLPYPPDIIEPAQSYPALVIPQEPEVREFVKYYERDGRTFIEDGVSRKEEIKEIVQPILRRHGLPAELSNVAFVESRFNPSAQSNAGAVGLWQFTKPTAQAYGLRVSFFNDERKDIVKATEAAALHLKDLYERFQHWPLALAAYNAGSARVIRAMEEDTFGDFFSLSRAGLLPKETRDFVVKVMAVTQIMRELDRRSIQRATLDWYTHRR